MGFSLSDLNPTSLFSNAAESLCDAVLPKELEFLGDAVGLAMDFQSGNWMKCLEDFQDLAQDFPQQLAQLAHQQQKPGQPRGASGPTDALMLPTFLEPTAPPPYGTTSNAQITTVATTVPTTTNGSPPTNPSLSAPADARRSPVRPGFDAPSPWARLNHQLTNQTPQTAYVQAGTAPTVRGTPPSSTTAATPAPQEISTPSPSSGAGGVSASATTAPASSAQAPSDPFFGKSDADLMKMVTSGQIPESITSDPAKMRQLQARVNQISEMNSLISQMMAALHEMMKSVIQNIRA